MVLSKKLKSDISDYILDLLRDGVRLRQYKSGKAIEDGARQLLDNDIALWPFLENQFSSIKVSVGGIVFKLPLTHTKIYSKEVIGWGHKYCINDPLKQMQYDMGEVMIRYSDDLSPEVFWDCHSFHHGHFHIYGGNWIKFTSKSGNLCMNGYKDPEDTALSFGFSSALLSTISYLKYSRYGSHIKGVPEE